MSNVAIPAAMLLIHEDYVQGAMLQMTGDQGAVLLCAEEHERLCFPPCPCPRLCSGCNASNDSRGVASEKVSEVQVIRGGSQVSS